ncbi:MAG: DUF1624 domain-containing protein [Firmicutes bacterium]|nr:DUF1624 domain-containing protein [Bacillota bacterium]
MLNERTGISRSRLLGAPKKKRAWEIDFLRGLCIFLVVMDHSFLDFWSIVPEALNWDSHGHWFFESMEDITYGYWFSSIRMDLVRPLVVFTFLFLSGISGAFSRSNRDRFFKLAAAASVVTLVTYFVSMFMGATDGRSLIIAFGILHIMALNVLVYMLVKKIFPHHAFYLVLGAALLFCGLAIPGGSQMELVPLTLSQLWPWVLICVLFILYPVRKMVQKNLAKNKPEPGTALAIKSVTAAGLSAIVLIFVLGFAFLFPEAALAKPVGANELGQFLKIIIGTGRYGSDYYGLLPYTGVFLIGASVGEVFYKDKKSKIPVLSEKRMGAVGLAVAGALLGFTAGAIISIFEGAPAFPWLSLSFGGAAGLALYGAGVLKEKNKDVLGLLVAAFVSAALCGAAHGIAFKPSGWALMFAADVFFAFFGIGLISMRGKKRFGAAALAVPLIHFCLAIFSLPIRGFIIGAGVGVLLLGICLLPSRRARVYGIAALVASVASLFLMILGLWIVDMRARILVSLIWGAGLGLLSLATGFVVRELKKKREFRDSGVRSVGADGNPPASVGADGNPPASVGADGNPSGKNRPFFWHSAISFVGRNAIWVYLIHQVVVLVVVLLSAMAAGYRFF